MDKSAVTRSDILEEEYAAGVTQLIRAGIILVISLLGLYLFGSLHSIPFLLAISGVGVAAAVILACSGGWRMYQARETPAVIVNCPYCDYPMQFVAEPTEDFDCEGCHRHVQYQNGVMIPIRTITCAFCKTVHKVSANATNYMCDRCNRALKLTDGPDGKAVVADNSSDILQNYDVILTQAGRNPTDVAMALESILVCNLVEARHQMERLPLTVMRNVPERKADAVKRRLRDLGATAITQPTTVGQQQRAGRA